MKAGWLTSAYHHVYGWEGSSTHNLSSQPLCRVWLARMNGLLTKCVFIVMSLKSRERISVAHQGRVLTSMDFSWRVLGQSPHYHYTRLTSITYTMRMQSIVNNIIHLLLQMGYTDRTDSGESTERAYSCNACYLHKGYTS